MAKDAGHLTIRLGPERTVVAQAYALEHGVAVRAAILAYFDMGVSAGKNPVEVSAPRTAENLSDRPSMGRAMEVVGTHVGAVSRKIAGRMRAPEPLKEMTPEERSKIGARYAAWAAEQKAKKS